MWGNLVLMHTNGHIVIGFSRHKVIDLRISTSDDVLSLLHSLDTEHRHVPVIQLLTCLIDAGIHLTEVDALLHVRI